MPREMYSIWWDDNLGPMIGRTFPEEATLTSEEALRIFMGHGIHQESKVGYTNLARGLVVSVLVRPLCIAVLLDEGEDPGSVERNLIRLLDEMDLHSADWDTQISQAFRRLEELMSKASAEELLARKGVRRLMEQMAQGLTPVLLPVHLLKGVERYPEALAHIPGGDDEVKRTLQDLEAAGVLVAKSYGRRLECRKCSGSEIFVTLSCPSCGSTDLFEVYTVHCPHCGQMFKSVIVDETDEISCQHCRRPVPVNQIQVLEVEILCNQCSTAASEPRMWLRCASCGSELTPIDILSGTGLAYELSPEWRDRIGTSRPS